MALLNKASMLSAEDFRYALVSVPEWGGEVRVRGLTAAEQATVAKKVTAKQTDDLAILLTVMACVDENGERVFDMSDRDALKRKPYAVLDRISKKILELSGGDGEGIETAVKN